MTDTALAQRVSSGLATPADIQTYRAAQLEASREKREMRAKRTQEFAEEPESRRKAKYKVLQQEFEDVSDEMRALSDTVPQWHELREHKIELAHEIEDMQAADKLATFNKVRTDRQKRSDDRRQLDVAKNAPFNEGGAPVGDAASGLPGSEDPPEGEQDTTIDSVGVLKGGRPHVALENRESLTAQQAVQRQ